jgi:hypothetical protein
MIQLSTVVFSLLLELVFILLVVLGLWTFLSLKRSKKDRAAATKLVEQVRHQSDLRLKETGSFLEQKYQFEGNGLDKAIKSIDKAEKKFIQKIINMYLKRESHELEVMDAGMAELIEAYKELTPTPGSGEIVAETDEALPDDLTVEVESLREANQKLTEELAITKKTMGNMIAEFGNMFGGGQDSSLETEEVLEKVSVVPDEEEELVIAEATDQEIPQVNAEELAEPVEPEPQVSPTDDLVMPGSSAEEMAQEVAEDVSQPEEKEASDEERSKKKEESLIDFDEGIDELMDGIDLSEDT